MVINNGIAEVLEYGDIVNGGLIFPDSVTAIDADIGQVEEMLELVRDFAANKAETIRFTKDGREIYGLSYYFPNLETFSAESLKEMRVNLNGCKKLYSVFIPSATVIGRNNFYKCRKLTLIDLPAVKTIENGAFEMSGLTKVSLNKDIKDIQTRAFLGTKISEVNVYGAKCAGSSFKKCLQLHTIKAEALTQISVNALTDCKNLIEICVDAAGKTNHAKRKNPYVSHGYRYALCIGDKVYECISVQFGGAYEYTDVLYPDGYSVYVLKNGSYVVFGNEYKYGRIAADVAAMKDILARNKPTPK